MAIRGPVAAAQGWRAFSVPSRLLSQPLARTITRLHGQPKNNGWWARAAGIVGGTLGLGAAGITTYSVLAEEAASGPSTSEVPAFRFGVIADIQYCDIDDTYNFNKTELRHYRGVLAVLQNAITTWNALPNVQFVANLGDIIDGQTEFKNLGSEEGLARVLKVFEKLRKAVPVIHMIGNHELYNFKRRDLDRLLRNDMNESAASYYAFRPVEGQLWKFVVLNSYEINMINNKEHDESKEAAIQYLERHNPNDLRKLGVNWLSGLEGVERRYVPYNGALGERQLAWLDAELTESDRLGERVVVLTHVPLAPLSATLSCLAWDYTRALEVMDAHSSVVTVFAGHDHSGGYWKRNGVHHLTFPSPLNAPSDRPLAHAIVDVHSDKLVVHGYGIVCDVAPKLFTEPGQSGQKYSAAVLDCPPRSDLGAVLPPPADSATAEA